MAYGKNIRNILYGGDYNPEQWPEEVWQEDMRMMKKAHVNIVTLNVFSWATLQPSEDTYDFSKLDKIMDYARENGLKVCLATSTGAHPAWMAHRHPDILRTEFNGTKRKFGGRHNSCPNSTTYRYYAQKLASKLAKRYKDYDNIVAWHISNEFGGECYCENCERAFRELQELGEELEVLGDAFLEGRTPSKVAVVVDWDNWWVLENSAGPSIYMKYLDALRDFYGAAFHQNVPVDLISVEDDLDPYQVVIAPLLYMTKGTYDEKIRAFVQNGGTFITSYFSGIVDEHDLVILGGYPGRLRDILGIWVEENDALPEGESNSFYYKGEKYPAEILCDLMHLEGANEISTYEEDFYQGTPVITKNAFGKGNAYYVGTRSNHEFYDIFLKDVFEEAGIKPVMKTPEGVEASVRRNQKGEVLFLLNHSGEEKKVLLEEDYLDLLGKDRLHKGDFVTLTKNDVKLL